MREFAADLRQTVARAEPLLAALGEERSRRHPAPGKWSPREVIGHLIDSASNNHQRFVRARWQDDLVFPGYEQAAWVQAQEYQDAPWRDLVSLWVGFNRHLARVMASTPISVLTKAHDRHNLDQLAWRAVPAAEPATLDYFMADYVAHLRHHLKQIFGAEWDKERDASA
jgi:hypothetical protein